MILLTFFCLLQVVIYFSGPANFIFIYQLYYLTFRFVKIVNSDTRENFFVVNVERFRDFGRRYDFERERERERERESRSVSPLLLLSCQWFISLTTWKHSPRT